MSQQPHRETVACALSDAGDPSPLQPEVAAAPDPDPGQALAVTDPGGGPWLAEADAPPSPTPYIDENGFDPREYKWVPVRRRPRKDGWSEAKQRLFIEVLADTACAETAARTVGMSVQSAYALRRAPGGEAFGEAWSAAIHQGAYKLVDIAFDRAIHGSDEPVFNKEGDRVGRRMRQNDRLLMFLLRAHLPERYRHAQRDLRFAGEPTAPALPSLAAAIARLEPAEPPEPHRLLPAHELDVEVEVADLCEGELPRWYRAEAPQGPPEQFPLGEAFERELEAAKAGNWRIEDWEQPKD